MIPQQVTAEQILFHPISMVLQLNTDHEVGFVPSDTQQLYEKNLKRQPRAWRYRKDPVVYKINSQGYRTRGWQDICWDDSVVLFGCSTVYSVGVDQADTLSDQLSHMIARPVVNLAVPGGSIYINYLNLVLLLQQGLRPKAIVNLWTDYTRLTLFDENTHNLGSWNCSALYREWNRSDHNSKKYAEIIAASTRLLTQLSGIPFIEASYFMHSARMFGCDHLPRFDVARDLVHPGTETHRSTAQWLAAQLQSNQQYRRVNTEQ